MLNIRVFAPQDNNKREKDISNNNNVITVIKKKNANDSYESKVYCNHRLCFFVYARSTQLQLSSFGWVCELRGKILR